MTNPATPSSISLPLAPLTFPGLDSADQDFLVALYIGAFSRAPEYEGLKFWAGELATALRANTANPKQLISREMYQAGEKNNEGGTGLDTAAYVKLAYTNSLGREPDKEGYEFWLGELGGGKVQRGDFLATFLDSALTNGGDGQYLQARLTVAEYAAQEHVSGPNANLKPGFLNQIITSVRDESSAMAAINSIKQQFGEAPPPSTPPADGGLLPIISFAASSGADTWNMNFEGYRVFEITSFNPTHDRMFFGDLLNGGEIEFVGEPRSWDELYSPEYFTGVAGQAALLRNTQQLIIDLDGDGRYIPTQDMLINMPGVYQLEDYNFIS